MRKPGKLLSMAVLGFSLFSHSAAWSQVSAYAFTQTSGTYTPITGGTMLIDGTSATSLDSWTSPAITIPAVSVNQTTYTTAYMTSNGLLKLGGNAPSTTLYTGISTNPDGGGIHICPFNGDLNKALSTAASEMRWQTVGNEVVFQWKGWCRYAQSENFDMQVRINTTNGVIRFMYNLNSGPGTGTDYFPQVGISRSTTDYNNRLVGSTAGQNWVNSVVGTSNSSVCRFTSASSNPRSFVSGQTYTFSPVACTTPNPGATIASPATSLCTGASVNLSLTNATAGEVVRYQWQSSADNATYTDLGGMNSPTATVQANMPYYRCRVICLGGPDTVYSTPVLLTYTNNILTATGAQRCGAGSVNLSATANTGTTINWYAAITGGTSLGTGATFTTPSISSTTNYYAAAEAYTPGANVKIGNATTLTVVNNTDPTAFNNRYENYWMQMVFTAAELQAAGLTAGNITAIKFDINTLGDAANVSNLSIDIGTTSNTTLTGFTTTGLTRVVNPGTYNYAVGTNTITFTTPYPWNGTSNLILDLRSTGLDMTNNAATYYTGTTGNTVVTAVTSTTYANPDAYVATNPSATTSTKRLNTTFVGTGLCSSPRVAATATINTAPVFDVTNNKTACNNAVVTLTVNSTQSSYNNVTWSPVTGLFTDAAATVPYVAGTHAYTVYQKTPNIGTATYIATANNTTTMCGAVDTVRIQTIPPGTTALATPGTLCISGTSTIALSPAIPQTGVQYQWQSSMDNITFVDTNGTAATYTTPTLSSTRYYRAVVKNSDGGVCFNTTSDTVLVSNPQVLTTAPATRCGVGTLTLGATTNAGNSLIWFGAATGGTQLGTGTSFTTPSLTATTNYWVTARSPGGGGPTITSKIGTGTTLTTTTEELTAFCNRRPSYKMQMIFTVAELNAMGYTGGNLYGIGFDITSIGDGASNAAFTVKVGPTAQNTFTGYIATGLNTVYGPSNYTHAVGNNVINFASPYFWDGASNIVVEITHNGVDALYNAETYYSTTSSDMTGYSYGSATTATNTTKRPNTTFIFSGPCESPRQQVTATVTPPPAFDVTNDKTVCNNAITTLTVNSPAANFNNVTWTPATNLYTNAAATTAYVAGANASTVYYKNTTVGMVMYTANATNTTSQCTNMDTVKIQTLPATATAIAAVGTLCQSGSTTLSLTPAITQTGLSYQWQSSMNNTTFVDTNGTSATYTTPTLTSTRYYRAVIKNSDGAVCFNSVSDTVVVNNPLVVTTTPADRCGPGTVTLGATANAGSTLLWYSAATGGTQVGTGTTFTTPSLAATTNYWVAARAQGGGGPSVTGKIGTGTTLTTTTEEFTAFCNRRPSYKMQMIFTVAELNAMGYTSGNLSAIGFDITSIGDGASNAAFTVKVGPTAANTFTGYIATGLNTVYGPSTYTHAVGNNIINFATPYSWDGTSNIVIEITHNGVDALYNAETYYSTTTNNMTGYSYGSTTTATNTTKRPNTTFIFSGPCESTRQQVTATIKTKPVATLTPNGTVNICEGATQTLTAGGVGNYSWLKNNAIIPGQTGTTYSVNQAGAYKAVVTNSVGCADTSVAANVTVQPKPVVNLGNDTAVCANVALTLDAQNPGAAYLWNDNSTNSTLTAAAAGQYRVKVTNTFNCVTSDTINITHLPVPVVNLGNDTMICHVVPLTLNAQNAGSSYAWNTGATTQTINVNQAGTYSVDVTNSNNCTGTDAIVITVMPNPVNDGFNFITLFNEAIGKIRFEPINADTNYTYAWNFGDGNTSTQMSPVHTYAAAGDYIVSMDISNGCTDTTVTLPIRIDFLTGTATVTKNNINMKLYPNPAQDQLNLELVGDHIFFKNIVVHNVIGQKVIDLKTNKTAAEKISTQALPAGMYVLKAETDKGIVIRKFEIIK